MLNSAPQVRMIRNNKLILKYLTMLYTLSLIHDLRFRLGFCAMGSDCKCRIGYGIRTNDMFFATVIRNFHENNNSEELH